MIDKMYLLENQRMKNPENPVKNDFLHNSLLTLNLYLILALEL